MCLLACALFAGPALAAIVQDVQVPRRAGSPGAAMCDIDFIALCKFGFLRYITEAIADGANVNATNDAGWTPLISAANCNDSEVITALLALGADPKAEDGKGKTAMDYARKNKNPENTEAFRRLEEASR